MSNNTTAFGSITLVDLTDAGEFSVYPSADKSLSVIYSPDDKSYNPNWNSANPLVLTPNAYYNGVNVNTNTNLSVTWFYQLGAGEKTAIEKSNSTYVLEEKKLKVQSNILNTNTQSVTFSVKATYRDATTGNLDVVAEGQITFNLITMPSGVRSLVLKGSPVFAQNELGAISPESITYTAEAKNVKDLAWTIDGNTIESSYVTVSSDKTTCTINKEYFISIKEATLTVTGKDKTDDTKVYTDSIEIHKVVDGTSQRDYSVVLSNEMQSIPCDSNGNILSSGGYIEEDYVAETNIYVFHGTENVTDECAIYLLSTTNIECYLKKSTGWVAISTGNQLLDDIDEGEDQRTLTLRFKWNNNKLVGDATFAVYDSVDAKNNEQAPKASKKMTLTKVQPGEKGEPGQDGTSPTIYSLSVNNNVIKKTGTVYEPALSAINWTVTKRTGNSETMYTPSTTTNEIFIGYDNGTTAASSSITGSPQKNIIIQFKKDGKTLLDSQTIGIISDGEDGQDAITFVLGNTSDTFSVSSDQKFLQDTSIDIPLYFYKGTTDISADLAADMIRNKFAVTAGADSIVEEKSFKIVPSPKGAKCSIAIGKNDSLKALNGSVTITATYNGSSYDAIYSWSAVKQPVNGQSSYYLDITTPSGYVFGTAETEKKAEAYFYEGGTEVTSGITYLWKQFNFSSSNADKYDPVKVKNSQGQEVNCTTKTLTVTPDMINGSQSFCCVATYNTIVRTAYVSFIDKSDSLSCELFSSVGNILKSGQTTRGYIYCQAYLNGNKINNFTESNFYKTTIDEEKDLAATYITQNGKTAKLTYTWVFNKQKADGTLEDITSTVIPSGNGGTNYYVKIDNDKIQTKTVINCSINLTWE